MQELQQAGQASGEGLTFAPGFPLDVWGAVC